jgi:ATP-binding cassette, subfamily B, bacterial
MTAKWCSDLKLYARILREARSYWPHLTGVFLLDLLTTPVALLTPMPLKIAVDALVGHPPPDSLQALLPEFATSSFAAVLALAAILIIAISLVNYLRYMATSVLSAHAGERLVMGFRAQLFRHIQRLSFSYHDTQGTADSIYRIQHDAPSIQWLALTGLTPFLTAGLTLGGMIFVIAQISLRLALVALLVLPFMYLATSASGRRLRTGWQTTKDLESIAFSVVQEVLAGLRVVKAFGQEDREQERFINRSSESARAKVKLAFVEGTFALMTGLTVAGGTAAALFIGARQVEAGHLSLGDLVLVMGYLAQLYMPVQAAGRHITWLQSSLASAERVFAVIDRAPDLLERPNPLPISRAVGRIDFRKVSFAYDGRNAVLRDISFEILPSTRLGISGATGAGKTTLVSLIVRFYDPTEGQVLLDGVDLRDYKLADLRSQFAIVLQDPVLFSTSIAENIAYARPHASEQEIIEAAKASGAHEFIIGLPHGYNTLVGERGMHLSGGERQRISVARAFLKNAPILILDEPTSSVDVNTEAAVMEALEHLTRGRTTIMIAHRLSTLSKCDVRLQVDSGRLIPVRSSASPAGLEAVGYGETHRV